MIIIYVFLNSKFYPGDKISTRMYVYEKGVIIDISIYVQDIWEYKYI